MSVFEFPKPNPGDPFDIESLLLTPEMLAAIPAKPAAPSKRKPALREDEPFLHISVRDFVRGVEVLKGAKELAVWAFILRQWRISRPEPVAVTNAGLAPWRVDRRTKYVALEKLAEAGLIQVETLARRNPRVVPLNVQ
jgi:hypothetical protein